MKIIVVFGTKFVIAGCLALIILSMINIPYFYTGIHIDNETGATDYIWKSYQFKSNMTEGYAWIKLDQYGFNNTHENAEKAMHNGVDILLMGSSHMEAVEVAENENVGYLLNEKLDGKNTYNIGTSGHDIYRNMDNMFAAVKTYEPKDYVIVETYDVELDEAKMSEVLCGTAEKIPSYDSGIVYHLQKIPAIKWIYKSLYEWISQSKGMFGIDTDVLTSELEEEEISEKYVKTLKNFLNIFAKASQENGNIPLIFYHQQIDILSDGTISFSTDEAYLNVFAETCEELGILFIDMTQEFLLAYEQDKKLPHGFINTYVGSGHMNAYGHRIIAEKLLDLIYKE